MSRHHLMVTYWRDTASPQGSATLTVADDDPRDVIERSNARVRQWMDAGLTEEPIDDDDEPEPDVETLGLGL
jgi:hypothetical protein